MSLEGNYLAMSHVTLPRTGTIIKEGYRNWVPCLDDFSDVEFWEESSKLTCLEREKEFVFGDMTKMKQLGVDSFEISEVIGGTGKGEKTLKFKEKGCVLASFNFNDCAGMKKTIEILKKIKENPVLKNLSIDQKSKILKSMKL